MQSYCIRLLRRLLQIYRKTLVKTKTMQKPTITTDIDIENDIDIDIDIELILFPKVNNIFRSYVQKHNPISEGTTW